MMRRRLWLVVIVLGFCLMVGCESKEEVTARLQAMAESESETTVKIDTSDEQYGPWFDPVQETAADSSVGASSRETESTNDTN